MALIPGERVLELVLEITLQSMKDQTPEQRQKTMEWFIQDIERWRNFWDKAFNIFKKD